jgi:hypothetical protein
VFPSSGQEVFENGWKFRLHASSPQPGRLYIVNEGPDAGDKTTLVMLYPGAAAGDGQPLASGATIGTGWYVFTDESGPQHLENFWVIASPDAVPVLEAARKFVNADDAGRIRDESIASGVARFLHDKDRPPPEVSADKVRKRTTIASTTPLLVHLVQLEHH